jgi:tetratricopeptide (TPR) repeat protein
MFRRIPFIALIPYALHAYAAVSGTYEQALDQYNHTDYKAAIETLQKLPRTAQSLELLGRSYLMEAEYKKATDTLEKAVALAPEDSMVWTWLGRAEGRRAETSFALNAMPHATKARDALEKAVELDPKNKEALDDLFDYYIQAPGFMGGGFDKANKLIPLIGKVSPAEATFAKGRMAEQKKDYDTAEAQFRRTVELAPNSVGRLLDLARFLAKRNRIDESERVFAQAAHIAPNAPRVMFARAELWIQSNRNVTQARNILQKYLLLDNLTPNDPQRPEALALLKKAGGN